MDNIDNKKIVNIAVEHLLLKVTKAVNKNFVVTNAKTSFMP